MSHPFRFIVMTPPSLPDVSLAIAASRRGELGVIDFTFTVDPREAVALSAQVPRFTDRPYGAKVRVDQSEMLSALLESATDQLDTLILSGQDEARLRAQVEAVHATGRQALTEVIDLAGARVAAHVGADALIAKGNEAGGYVGEETTFILLQALLQASDLPVYAHGGIGEHTVAACYVAGAAGAVLDAQVLLARESRLPRQVRERIAAMDGSETTTLGGELGRSLRLYLRPGLAAATELRDRITALIREEASPAARRLAWQAAVAGRVGWQDPEENALLLGQDAAFAADLADRFVTVAGIIDGLKAAIEAHVAVVQVQSPLDRDASLAQSHGTRYPIVQGPMTRVSDRPAFIHSVAEAGALPFLALALMRKDEVLPLLAETRQALGGRPWGVGILGFVPPALRQEQLEAMMEVPPDYAIIAGGRPDQALALEQKGIPTYLHVPSPALLEMFLKQGANRFIFEGRECGGHVGPRSSFVLWNSMIDVLAHHLASDRQAYPPDYHILFAGGIHDARSAAMVATMAAPLAEQGVRIGVLMGTAYLFTAEAVSSQAILPAFQDEAIKGQSTVVVETGPGHLTRCLPTAFVDAFERTREQLVRDNASAETMREELEALNVGRLRIASKGITRHPQYGQDPDAPKYIALDEAEQRAQGMYMIGQVAGLRDRATTMVALHEEVTAQSARFLQTVPPFQVPAPTLAPARPSRVAIVGMACVLPGAGDLKTYWENILDSVDSVTEVPAERWDWKRYFDPDKKAPDRIYSRWGGFIKDVPFDPLDYGMPPNSVKSIEPVQLLMLEVVRAALDDAGYDRRPFERERASCVIAVGGGLGDLGTQYGFRSYVPHFLDGTSDEVMEQIMRKLPEWTEDSFPGILLNVLAGRVANRFDLGGANFVVDAACGSSLAALDAGVKGLEAREVDLAIVGAGETVQSPFGFLAFSKTQALSPTGRCRPFDEDADGIAISEGLAVLVLKRLEDAQRDGDRVYAVIDGVGASSDGRDRSLTAPRPIGQMRAVNRAYRKAGVSPATVRLFEAHGTGTTVGDVAEAETLDTVLKHAHARPKTAALGSVKSMIGHTKSTAGLAGLIKVALSLYHQVLPPTLVNKPNRKLYQDDSALYVNSELRPWIRHPREEARRAGVSAFGFGGTNFHTVLQEHRDFLTPGVTRRQWPVELLLFAGRDRADLRRRLERLADWLGKGDPPPLRDVAYSLYRQFEGRQSREGDVLAMVASSLDDLREKLAAALEQLAGDRDAIDDPRGIYYRSQPLARRGGLAFIYPGQGSQYPKMLQDLATMFPVVQGTFERANRALEDHLPQPLSDYIFPRPAHRPAEQKSQDQALMATQVAQPALGAANLAMHELLQALGLQPTFLAGHSYGEIVALRAAGVITEEEMFAISAMRGKFMAEAAGPQAGTMAAVRAGRKEVAAIVGGIDGLTLANINAPTQTVISGPDKAIETAIARLQEQDIGARRLPVACAFHSPLVAPARDRLANFIGLIELRSPRLRVYANSSGAAYPDSPAEIREILSGQLARPVEFQKEIEAMYASGARVFVECGPKSVLSGLIDQILGSRPHAAIFLDHPKKHGLESLQRGLAQLAAHGLAPNLEPLFVGREPRLLQFHKPYRSPEHDRFRPTTWLVNGGRARAWSEAMKTPELPATQVSIKLTETPGQAAPRRTDAAPAPSNPPVSDPAAPAHPTPAGALPPPPAPAPRRQSMTATNPTPSQMPPAQPATDLTQVVLQYQQLMGQFLQAQQNIMMAYLGGAPAAVTPPTGETAVTGAAPMSRPALPATAPEAQPAPVAPPVSPSGPPAADVPAAAQAARLDRDQIAALLRALVSDRTGYPPELLGLEADLEADLGIDSIKRVEILGAFRELHPEMEAAFGGDRMEQLQTQRTLEAMIGLLVEGAGSATVAPAPDTSAPRATAQPAAATGVAVDAATVTRQLVGLVSERTGYPAELLLLEADLEADLGIDSIKRVEILGAFREQYPELEPAFAGDRMEQMQAQRTLEALIGLLTEHIAGDAAPSRAQVEAPAITPATAAPAPSAESMAALLIDLVSERTGYPPELLSLSADLEADLGIDSIKRVEILGAFRDQHPSLAPHFAGEGMEHLQAQRTLGAMVEMLAQPPGLPVGEPDPKASAASEPEASETSTVLRFTLTPTPAPLRSQQAGLAAGRTIVLTDDGLGVADAVAAELQSLGYPVALVRHTTEGLMLNAEYIAANLTEADEVVSLVSAIRETLGPIAAVVHLAPLGGQRDFARQRLDDWRHALSLETLSLFHLVRAAHADLATSAESGGACILAATDMGGTFASNGTLDAAALAPSRGGIVGLLKTVAHELPTIRTKAVDLNPRHEPIVAAHVIVQEMMTADDLVEVGYDGETRKTLTIVPALLPSAETVGGNSAIVNDDSIILVTGGARGITADVARELARLYQPTLILVGRSPLPPADEATETADLTDHREIKSALIAAAKARGDEVSLTEVEQAFRAVLRDREMRENLASMQALGARVHYFSADVRDEAEFGSLLDRLYERFGRLDGVIHGAGIIEDKLIKDKTPESFSRVLSTKADSAFILSRKLRPESLRFLVFFSSVTGRFGNRGQGDYAAANEVLNKLAVYLDHEWPARVVSMNWGPWDAGMVSDEVRRQFERRGVTLIPIPTGKRRLIEELNFGRKGEVEVIICGEGDGEALAT